MIASESPYVAPSQDTLRDRTNLAAIRGESALKDVVRNLSALEGNAVLSPEDLEVLKGAAAILKRVQTALG